MATGRRSGTFRSEWTVVDGLRLHAMISTDPVPEGSPTVVLVHGLGLSHRYMMPVAEHLAAEFRVFVPDLPGHGPSDTPDRVLDVSGLADGLDGWMKASGVGPSALLGNSFGCQIIADLAVRYPELVDRAVLQGPTTPKEERNWLWQFIRWRQNSSKYNPPSMKPIARQDYKDCGYARVLRTFRYSLWDRIEDKMPHIQAPTMIVRGALDPICHQHWVEELTGLLPDGRLVVIPEKAHTLVYTAPEELTEAVRPFLDESKAEGARRGDRATGGPHSRAGGAE